MFCLPEKIIVCNVLRKGENEEVFTNTVAKDRAKCKACVAACKKAAIARKCSSGIDDFINKKRLYPGSKNLMYLFNPVILSILTSTESKNPYVSKKLYLHLMPLFPLGKLA